MQINENEARDDETREILDYYRGLPERSSQEASVEMLRELQDIHGCISPYMLEQAAAASRMCSPENGSRPCCFPPCPAAEGRCSHPTQQTTGLLTSDTSN